MLRSTGGGSLDGLLSIVIATRNVVRAPLASSSSPLRTCRPSPSAPVAKVRVEPETEGAGAAAPSSWTPGAVTGSLAVSAVWYGAGDSEASAGADGARCGATAAKRTVGRAGGADGVSSES